MAVLVRCTPFAWSPPAFVPDHAAGSDCCRITVQEPADILGGDHEVTRRVLRNGAPRGTVRMGKNDRVKCTI